MNGKYPNVIPYRLPIQPYLEDSSNITQPVPVSTYVATYLGPQSSGGDSFNMSTINFPVDKYTFYESHIQGSVCLILYG